MRLAESYRLKADLPNAIKAWEKAALLNTASLVPILSRAMALDQTGRKAEALTAYNEVLARDPAHFEASNNAAWLLADANTDLDRALRLANAASELAAARLFSPSAERRAEIQRIQSQLR